MGALKVFSCYNHTNSYVEMRSLKGVHTMNQIINQLSEIEKTADTIVSEAVNKKESIFQEAEEKKKAFETEIAQEEERRITQLRQTLYAKKDQDMTDLRASTQEAVKSILEIYDQQHSILAQQIVDRIVGA